LVTLASLNMQQRARDLRTTSWWKDHALMLAPWMLIILAVFAAIAAYFLNNDFRYEIDYALEVLKTGDQAAIQDYLAGYGSWAPVVSVVIMICQNIIIGIPASIVLFANGVAFGTGGGAVINIVGRMAGAAIVFGIARMLGKGAVEKMVGKIAHDEKFSVWMQRRGGWAVFASRAIPGMPSDMLSYVAGFTNISWRTYIVATLLGFLPQSIVYAWFGAEATNWFWAVMMIGWVTTGLITVTAFVVQWVRRTTHRQTASSRARIR
jgi:uncharacterized membrane protein YdjX (TVP38/TMEM64 family)